MLYECVMLAFTPRSWVDESHGMLKQSCVTFYLLIAGVMLLAVDSVAAVYRYVDRDGQVHLTNVPVATRYRYYQAEKSDRLPRAGIGDLIQRYAELYNLEPALLRAVIRAESNFCATAVSSKGALGLMQLHPDTLAELAITDAFDPEQNIAGGSRYLRKMLRRFNGDLELALAAYNAGPGTVEQYGGVPPFSETRTYIERVKTFARLYKQDEI